MFVCVEVFANQMRRHYHHQLCIIIVNWILKVPSEALDSGDWLDICRYEWKNIEAKSTGEQPIDRIYAAVTARCIDCHDFVRAEAKRKSLERRKYKIFERLSTNIKILIWFSVRQTLPFNTSTQWHHALNADFAQRTSNSGWQPRQKDRIISSIKQRHGINITINTHTLFIDPIFHQQLRNCFEPKKAKVERERLRKGERSAPIREIYICIIHIKMRLD